MVLLAGSKMPGAEIFAPKVLFSILYVALVSSALALLLLFKLLKVWGALKTSVVTYVVPIIALSSDFIINGRAPNIYEILGVGVIILSLYMIQFDKVKS